MKKRCGRSRQKPKLIKQWKNSWKLTSVQAAALLAFCNLMNAEVLPLFNFTIPYSVMNWVNAILGLSIIALRLIVQPDMSIEEEMPPPHEEVQADD